MTKKQLRESIAIPKVGVKYSDGAGSVRNFGVADASDLGSLDAAFGAAAAGVRNPTRDKNLDLAKILASVDDRKEDLKPRSGSAVVIENKKIYLVGENQGGDKERGRFFGTNKDGKKGWHRIDRMDEPRRGELVGQTLCVKCEADKSSKSITDNSPWSFQVSRTSFKKDDDTGEIKFFNYFRTFYVSGMGRIIGASDEEEVLVGVFTASGDIPCARPVFGDSEKTVIESIDFATATQFKTIDSETAKQPDKEAAKASVKNLKVGEFSAKAEFSNGGILSRILFGSAFDIKKNSSDETKVKKVETHVGCPYQEE